MRRSSSICRASATGCAATVLCLAALLGCARPDGWIEQRQFAMGTWVDTIYRAPDAATRERLEVLLDQLLARFAVDYYAWTDGELGRLNAALGAGTEFTASPELVDLLERARALSRASDGYFDPGVGALVEAWGFHSADSEPREPDPAMLAAWQSARTSIADLRIDGLRLRAPANGLLLDLGGIAKGEIVDRILAAFAATGVSDVLVNAGGDVRVAGTRGTRRWSIGIQDPRAAELLGAIELDDGEAAFTSGDYERFFETAGGRSHHLLDPTSGRPATHTRAVTVIADNGALADAAATALFVAGPGNWRRIAAALGIEYALRVDASGRIQMTPSMRERFRMHPVEEPATML